MDVAITLTQGGEPFDLSAVSRIDLHAKAQGKIVLKLSSVDGSIEVVQGKIILHISHALTAGEKWSIAEYDMQLINNGRVQTVLQGSINMTHDITEVGDAGN